MNSVNGSLGCTPNELVFGGFCGAEEELFIHKTPQCPATPGSQFVSNLQIEQAELFARAEAHQAKELARIAARADARSDVWIPQSGDWVLAARGGFPHGRPRDKLQLPLTGPYRVLDRGDSPSNVICCLHAANRQVVKFSLHELTPFNVELMDSPEDYEKAAQRDFWEYSIDSIVNHRPQIPRRQRGRRARPKRDYEFLIRYKHLPLSSEEGAENPSWQPWSFVQHLTALRDYCSQPGVEDALGNDFYVEASVDEEED